MTMGIVVSFGQIDYLSTKPMMAGYDLENCVMQIKLNFNILFERIDSKMYSMIWTHICMEPLDVISILYEWIHCYWQNERSQEVKC